MCDMTMLKAVELWESQHKSWTERGLSGPQMSPSMLWRQLSQHDWNTWINDALASKDHAAYSPFRTALCTLQEVWEAGDEITDAKLDYIERRATILGLKGAESG